MIWKLKGSNDSHAALRRSKDGFFSSRWSADYREKGRRIAYRRSGPGPGYSLEIAVKQIVVK